MTRALYSLLLVGVLVALALPATAAASSRQAILDCARDGKLDREYSNQELKQALEDLPSDLAEYSDCRQALRDARTDPSGGGAPGPGGGGEGAGGALTPAEQAARERDAEALAAIAGSGDSPSIRVGGETVEPGSGGVFDLASAGNGLPLPLLLALIAVALLVSGGGVYALRGRLPALARIPLTTKRISLPRVGLPRFRR